MNFQLVPVRVEEVDRFTFTRVLLPPGVSAFRQLPRECFEIFGGYRESKVCVFPKRTRAYLHVVNKTEPQAPQGQIGSVVPSRTDREPEQFRVISQRPSQVTHRQRDVIQSFEDDTAPSAHYVLLLAFESSFRSSPRSK